MNKLIILTIISLTLLVGCVSFFNGKNTSSIDADLDVNLFQPNPLRIELNSIDGVKLVGLMHESKTSKAIILVHQLNSSKESYSSLAKKLNAKGFTTIAIDLRGHGESIEKNNKKYLWVNFNTNDYVSMEKDVNAFYNYLKQKGLNKIYLIGASVGANTVLNFASKNKVEAIVLLSPSLDYKGIKTKESAKKINTPVFIACSKQDYSFNDCNKLNELIQSEKETHFIFGQKHGSKILKDEFVEKSLIEWIQKN